MTNNKIRPLCYSRTTPQSKLWWGDWLLGWQHPPPPPSCIYYFCWSNAVWSNRSLQLHIWTLISESSYIQSRWKLGGGGGGRGGRLESHRMLHFPLSTQGLFFISSGFRNGSLGTPSSIHFNNSGIDLEDISRLKASWYFRLSTSFFICGASISSMVTNRKG